MLKSSKLTSQRASLTPRFAASNFQNGFKMMVYDGMCTVRNCVVLSRKASLTYAEAQMRIDDTHHE